MPDFYSMIETKGLIIRAYAFIFSLALGRRLAEKGIEIGKREIEEVPSLEAIPKYSEDSAE